MKNRICFNTAAAALTCLLASNAYASNAFYLNGWGSSSRALAGAGVALAEDAMVIATNPAGLAGLKKNELVLGSTFFYSETTLEPGPLPPGPPPPGAFPLRPGFYVTDPDTPNQIGDIFPIPFGAISWRLSERDWVGFSVYGNGGLNTNFKGFPNELCPPGTPQSGVLCFGTFAADVAQIFLSPTYARQMTPWLRVGISPLLVIQNFEVRGVGAFAPFSRDPDKLTNNGHEYSYGYGAKIGIQAQLLPNLALGVAAQSRIYMDELDDYSGLLAEQGDLDLPPYFQVGLAWDVTPRLTLVADVLRLYFNNIRALGNSGNASGRFGDDDGPGFGWRNLTGYKAGLRYQINPQWVWRAGVAYNEHVVDRQELSNTLLALGVFQEHFNTGLSYDWGGNRGIDISLVYVPQQTIDGPNSRFPGQEIEASSKEIGIDIGWRYGFD